MKFLAQQDGRSPLCPSCQECKETCTHIALCPEMGRTEAFKQSTREVGWWLEEHKTQPDLQSLLLMYLCGRGTKTCMECTLSLQLSYAYQEFAISQDIIGWDRFVMGMVSTKLLLIQCLHSVEYLISKSNAVNLWLNHTTPTSCPHTMDLPMYPGP